MLSALSDAGVEFLIVGAHALAAHGAPRATRDLDIWVNPTPENAARVMKALRAFGAALMDLTEEDLTTPGTVFQIGVDPFRVDILTAISGVAFDEAWKNRLSLDIEGVRMPVLGRQDFIANKRATGRTKDLADIEELE
jgi:predicted nucleotidyltransferase